jgi:hypothetical protein
MGFEDQIAKAQQPIRKGENFSPVNDLFAPFFDVVFYSLEETDGIVEGGPEEGLGTIAGSEKLGASRLQIRSVGGGLQSFNPQGEGSELAELTNYRANLQVTMLSAAALQATLTLTPPYEAALKIVDNRLIRFGSLMEIQWGYLSTDGDAQPAISDKGLFRITQPSIKFGREVVVTIGGFDILSSSLSTADVRCCWSREEFKCDLDILRRLIKAPRAPDGLALVDGEVSNESPLRKRKERDVIQSDSDWAFFRRICRQNDVAFEQKGAQVILRDENRIDLAKPKYRLTWFMQPQNQFDVPMISFESNPILSLFANEPGARGQRTVCRNAETGKIEIVNKDPSKTGVPQQGNASDTHPEGYETEAKKTNEELLAAYQKLDENVCASGRIYTVPCSRPNKTEEIERTNREARRLYNTHATVVCPGVPGLIPQQIAEVENVGCVFSGSYRIMKATHNIGAGYTVKLDLIRASSTNCKDGAPASSDKDASQPVDAEAPVGAEVFPIDGGDGVFGSNQTSLDGCADEQKKAETQKAKDIIKANPPNQGATA